MQMYMVLIDRNVGRDHNDSSVAKVSEVLIFFLRPRADSTLQDTGAVRSTGLCTYSAGIFFEPWGLISDINIPNTEGLVVGTMII